MSKLLLLWVLVLLLPVYACLLYDFLSRQQRTVRLEWMRLARVLVCSAALAVVAFRLVA